MPQAEKLRDSIEILVGDDSSADDTREMLAENFPAVQWHRGEHLGPAANRNRTTSKAGGDWLIFLDDDCLPAGTYLSGYLAAIEAVREGRIVLHGPTVSPGKPSLLWEAPHNPDGDTLISCNFAIEKTHFLKIGGFEERFPFSFEDMEFGARLFALGAKLIFVPEAAVEHPLRPVPGASSLASRWEGKVIISLFYGAKPSEILIRLPWHVSRIIQSRFRGKRMAKDNIRAAFLFAHEWLLVCRHTPGWLRKRASQPRPEFWVRYFATHQPVPKSGF